MFPPLKNLYFAVLVVCAFYVMETTSASGCEPIYNPTSDGKLDYVKKNSNEWNDNEIVTEGGRRQLFCEVNNYCELLWYDGATGEPILEEKDHIEFEDDNQTLTIIKALKSDTRSYTCKASNDKEALDPRTIMLYVLDGTPGSVAVGVPLQSTCGNATADLDETWTFTCLYTVTDISFAFIEPSWKKQNETNKGGEDEFLAVEFLNDINNKTGATTRYQEIYYYDFTDAEKRDGFLIFNTTLVVHNISEDAYGLYQIFVSVNGGEFSGSYEFALNPNPLPVIVNNGLIRLAVSFGVVLTLVVIFLLTYCLKKLEIKLCWKDNCDCQSPDWALGDVASDAYISYGYTAADTSSDDLNFVVNVLKSQLESRGYTVVIRDIDHAPGTSIPEEIVKSLDRSRRCILVISPAYLKSWIGTYDINLVMDSMKNYKRQIIPIVYRDISQVPEADSHKLLKHIMQDVKCLKWPKTGNDTSNTHGTTENKLAKKEKKFFKELMLRMPPLRLVSQTSTVNTNASLSGLTASVESISETTPPTTAQGTPIPTHNFQYGQNGHPSIYPTCPPLNSNI